MLMLMSLFVAGVIVAMGIMMIRCYIEERQLRNKRK